MNSRQVFLLARLTVLLVALSVVTAVQADPRQWDQNGVAIRQGAGIGAYSVAQNAQGYSLIVWCDLRNGSDDLFAQLINPAGAPQWSGNAVVCTHPSEQVNPVVVAVNDGWIIFWIDHRHGCGSNIDPGWGDIYAQKLNDSGQRMWAANNYSGVAVDVNTLSQVSHRAPLIAAADGSGGALVAWLDSRAGLAVLAQRVSASGQMLWASPLSVADTMRLAESYVGGTGDANGNLFLGWYERRDHVYKLRAVRITPDGVRAWGGSGVYVNTEGAWPSQRPQFCPDGEGGCYVAWVRNDIFVQRLDSTGAAHWNPGGIRACHVSGQPSGMSLDISRNGSVIDGCVLAWCENREWPTFYVISSQKVSPVGTALWDTAGVCIVSGTCGSSTEPIRGEPKVISDQSGGLVCTWLDGWSGTLECDLYASRLDSAGVSQWGTECTPVWVSPAGQRSAVPVAGPSGTFVFWIDVASGATSLRYQHLDRASGTRTLAEGGVSLHSGICSGAEHARSLMLSPGRYAAVWVDNRSWTCRELYYQIFDQNGQALGPVNGSLLTPGHTSDSLFQQTSASLCTDGSGGFYVLFLQYTAETSLAVAAHVSATGDLLSPPEGIALPVAALWIGDECYAVPDGNGGCYAVWWAYDAMFLRKHRVQRIAASGETDWDEPVTLNDTSTVDQDLRDAVMGAEGSCTIIYMEGPESSSSLYGVNVLPDGEIGWTTHICDSLRYDYIVVEPDGNGGFVCAWEADNGTERLVRAQHVSSTGALLWPLSLPQVASGQVSLRNIVQDGLGNIFVGWISWDRDIYLQKINSSGTLLWQMRRQVAAGACPWSSPMMMRDGGSGLFVCWKDYRGLRPHIYATHVDGEGETVNEPYWGNGGGLVSTSWDEQEDLQICADGFGGMIVVYTDNKGIEEVSEPPQIYAQRVNDGIVPSAAETRTETPLEFALKQNYPNPFNPLTQIEFDLARGGHATLEVFDLLGRKVTTLVDGVLPMGAHRVTVDGANLPSGTYIYRLQAANFSQSRKMLLLK